jgi:NEDD4-binding protein 2
LAKQLAEQYKAPIFSADNFFMEGDRYNWSRDRLEAAHAKAISDTEDAMMFDVPVIIVDNTNTLFSEMRPYVEMAMRHRYEVVFKEPDWSPELRDTEGKWNEEFLNRMQQAPDRTKAGKSIPPSAIQRMLRTYQYDPTVEKILQSKPFRQ